MKFRSLLIVVFFSAAALPVMSQEERTDAWQSAVEQWADRNETGDVPEDLMELMNTLSETPLNLNDTFSAALLALPFVTPFQYESLKAYVEQNGYLKTTNELYFVAGFDSTAVGMLLPYVVARRPARHEKLTLAKIFGQGHGSLLAGTRTSLPLSRGYNEDLYLGSPLRLYWRYSYKYTDKVAFQIAGEKDAGEPMLGQGGLKGFDYYSYCLMLNDIGIVKRAIVGKYHLQFGQGATLWTGFAPWGGLGTTPWRYGQGIRAASAFCEYGFLNGGATTLRFGKRIEATAFVSYTARDANTIVNTADDELAHVSTIYNTGLHRTQTEIDKKSCLGEMLYGGNIAYRRGGLAAGFTLYHMHFDTEVNPQNNVYNTFRFRGRDNTNFGLDVSYRIGRLILFGELACALNDSIRQFVHTTDFKPFASVVGGQMSVNSSTTFSAVWHYASPIYQNLFANMVGYNSDVQNENGVCLSLKSAMPMGFQLQTDVEFSRFPWLRYRVYSPSSFADVNVMLSKNVTHGVLVQFRYRNRLTQRNAGSLEYYTEDIRRQQIQMVIDCALSASVHTVSRLYYCWFSSESSPRQKGFYMAQDVVWKPNSIPVSLTARIAMFDVSAYDARVFVYENDLMYEYSVPSFTGQGMRFFLVARYSLSSRVALAAKYALLFRPEDETIGSGYDNITSNHRHEFKLQMRVKFPPRHRVHPRQAAPDRAFM